jgi:hypothetical protein
MTFVAQKDPLTGESYGLNIDFEKERIIPKVDSIVNSIIDKFVARAEFGEKKYGVTLDREDLSIEDYINHALEEHMDAILYLQKVKIMLEQQRNG